MKDFITYEDFGAVGDGVTNDFFAMKRAHIAANEAGLSVKGTPGKTYLITDTEIDGVAESIPVMTDVDLCGATLIVDDSDISWREGANKRHNTATFEVKSPYKPVSVDEEHIAAINAAGGIIRNVTQKIDTGLGFPAMLVVTNSNTMHYKRYGYNANSGSSQKELIVVDKDGNIDEKTHVLYDFETVTGITAYRIDLPTLTIKNWNIISRASQVNIVDKYYSINRGIRFCRPNVCVTNVRHKITGEILKGTLVDGVPFIGHSYNSFFQMHLTHNVTFEDCTFQSRAHYLQGTYEIGGWMSNKIVFKNCDQYNFFKGDPEYPLMPSFGQWWGVAGTNSCKNMIYDNCKLTRFDAHQGVYNGIIRNCEIGSIRLTGGGDMLIENTKIYNWDIGNTLQLREDYGCTWRGTLTLKDCEIVDVKGNSALTCVIVARSANHDYGYVTYFPNVVIDNLKIQNAKPLVNLFSDFSMKKNARGLYYRSIYDENLAIAGAPDPYGEPNVNPYTPPEFIKVINNEKNGYELTIPDVPFFKDTKIEGVKKVEGDPKYTEI